MKYICSALVLLALVGNTDQVNAIKINQKAAFTDDLVKSLAEEMQKDVEEEVPATEAAKPAQSIAQKSAPAKPAATAQTKAHNASANGTSSAQKKATKAPVAHVAAKKKVEDEEIPMDAAAIKAYSSVIADAAEDSEPAVPVQYAAVEAEEHEEQHSSQKMIGADPMGSMIQNEITSIKMASIKASED